MSTDILDKDDFKAIDHAMLDKQYMSKLSPSMPCDVYVWGSNSNYTLGTGSQQPRRIPELLTHFSRTNADIQKVIHTVF